QESKWRIMQVDHMVITHMDSQYEFEGDIKTLPAPIRLPFGEALATDLEKAGLKVDMAKEARNNFRKLMRDKTGVVITTSVMAEEMNKQFEFKDKFIISPTPLASQSYFLAFSKKSEVSDDEKKKIWEEIARWRDDYLFMLQIFAQY
ncbi:hypothetical protein QUF76_09895, partial [Desulfobacterales bacterium HSG16]|nr:hypothetical protein [Desulfobacterales bacterium HSG16]